jgi:hypothetical protein
VINVILLVDRPQNINPWKTIFLFSPRITGVWPTARCLYVALLCCCNVTIFFHTLWHISINKVHYLITEKMQKSIKLSYFYDMTKHGHKAKPSQGLRKLMWLFQLITISITYHLKSQQKTTSYIHKTKCVPITSWIFQKSKMPRATPQVWCWCLYCARPFQQTTYIVPFKQTLTNLSYTLVLCSSV